MKLSEVITLIGAGYTKEDIEAMTTQENLEVVVGKVVEPEAPAAEPEKPAEAPAPKLEDSMQVDPKPVELGADNAEVLKAIKDLTKAIQASNVRTAANPDPVSAAEKADEILKSIIR